MAALAAFAVRAVLGREAVFGASGELIVSGFSMRGAVGSDRGSELGEQSDATVENVAARTTLPKYDAAIVDGMKHCRALYEMFRAGASAFLVKDCAFEELEDAVRVVHSGGKYIGDCLKNMLSDMFLISLSGSKQKLMEEELSSREIEVLSLLAEGLTNREAADRLHLSVNTVASHRQNIMRKLALKNTVEMTKYAIRKGYIGL